MLDPIELILTALDEASHQNMLIKRIVLAPALYQALSPDIVRVLAGLAKLKVEEGAIEGWQVEYVDSQPRQG